MSLLSSTVFCRTRTKAWKLSTLKACLTQTRMSDQMELSQGCPIGCDTCVWVRVFHYSFIVVVYHWWRKSMHFNEVECFYYLWCICTQSILQNYTWIKWHWLMYWVYIFRFIHLPLDKATTQLFYSGMLLCLWQVWHSTVRYSIGRVGNCSGTVSEKLHYSQTV